MITLTAKVEKRELDKYRKRLDKNRDKPLRIRVERNIRAASQRILVPRIKTVAPKSGIPRGKRGKRKGTLRGNVKAKLVRKRAGEVIRPTWTGSGSFYTHMIVGGTQSHRLDPRASGRTVSFVGRRSGPRTFIANDELRNVVRTPWGVKTLTGFPNAHPGLPKDPFIARGTDRALPAVYALIERSAFDTR